MNKTELFPVSLLAKVSRESAQIAACQGVKQKVWQALDEFIPVARGEIDIAWPESVFMPFGLWPCFLERYFRFPEKSFDLGALEMKGMAQLFAGVAAWRPTQDIIRFDPEIEAEIRDMEPGGKLPSEIFLRLPAWCVYVETPGIVVDGDEYQGFFVQLDSRREGVYLALTFEAPDFRQNRVPIALGDFILEESIAQINSKSREKGETTIQTVDAGLIHAINLVIYICAYGLSDSRAYSGTGTYARPVKTGKGFRIFPPDKPKVRLLGKEFGEKIREKRREISSTGASKKPHLRRPHWHGFWTGRHDMPERKLEVRWLPPIFVGNRIEEEKFAD